ESLDSSPIGCGIASDGGWIESLDCIGVGVKTRGVPRVASSRWDVLRARGVAFVGLRGAGLARFVRTGFLVVGFLAVGCLAVGLFATGFFAAFAGRLTDDFAAGFLP